MLLMGVTAGFPAQLGATLGGKRTVNQCSAAWPWITDNGSRQKETKLESACKLQPPVIPAATQ